MDNDEIKERKHALESKKRALLNRLKKINSQVNYKNYELKVLKTLLKDKHRPDTRRLKRKLNYLEFKVQTEATSLKIERQYMKEINQTQDELKDTFKTERLFRKQEYLQSDINEASKELDSIERELQETNSELHSIEKETRKIEVRKNNLHPLRDKKRKKKEHDKDSGQYMGEIDATVSLEDICVIKRKEKD